MSYFAPYIDAAGLHIPTYEDRLEHLLTSYASIFGPEASLSESSPDYQLLSLFARSLDDVSQLLANWFVSRNPSYAAGAALDLLLPLFGLTRRGATASTAFLTLTGTPGAVLSESPVVRDDAGYLWTGSASSVSFTAVDNQVRIKSLTVKYVKERKQFGRPISAFQNTQFQLANLDARIQAARLLVREASYNKDVHKPYAVEAARCKLIAAETAMEVTTKAVQFHGGYGYTREYPVERMMRDAKITEIYEGTSEVQRMVIAGKLFGKIK